MLSSLTQQAFIWLIEACALLGGFSGLSWMWLPGGV